MTESILNLGTRLIDDGFDEFIMITADPHVLSRNKRKNFSSPTVHVVLMGIFIFIP